MPTAEASNRRASRRKGLRQEARLLLDAQDARGGQVVDLGTDGASFVTTRPVTPGSRGELHFELPSRDGGCRVEVRVRTVYSSFVGEAAVPRFRIGMSFLAPDAATMAALSAFVADPP